MTNNEIQTLKDKNEALIKALLFYANKSTYVSPSLKPIDYDSDPPPIDIDKGNLAREVLDLPFCEINRCASIGQWEGWLCGGTMLRRAVVCEEHKHLLGKRDK